MTIIRSIDLGYGCMKFTARNPYSFVPPHVVHQFSALVLPVSTDQEAMDTAGLREIHTVTVETAHSRYVVGPDAALLLADHDRHNLDSASLIFDRNAALVLGALAYMRDPVIDVLVVGVPASQVIKTRMRLDVLFGGGAEVPMLSDSRRTRQVEIRRTVVVPQTLGGFFDAKTKLAGREAWGGTTLLIDAGYFTFNWAVVAEDSTYVHTQSGTFLGGVESILRIVADDLERKLDAKIRDVSPIDSAIRGNKVLCLHGQTFNLNHYKSQIYDKCKTYISAMAARLGRTKDLRRVVLCGGGAGIFKDAVSDVLSHRNAIVLKDPILANVRGLQIIGREVADSQVGIAA